MRILIVNSWYFPNMKGGAEQSTKLLAENLLNAGHQVAVLSGDGVSAQNKVEEVNGVSVYRIRTALTKEWHGAKKVYRKLIDLKNKQLEDAFDDICQDFRPDVIHTNSLSGISFCLWKLAADRKIPVVHTLRDYSVCSPKGVFECPENVKIPYKAFLQYYAKKGCAWSEFVPYVTAPSEFTLKALLNRGYFSNAKSECVVNAVNVDLNEVKQNIQMRKEQSRKKKVILYAGRLLELKGVRLLIDTFRELNYEDVELRICGEGELEAYVKENASKDKRIIYCGQLSQQQLNEEYLKADFVVMPSLWDEPFGRIVIEANKHGAPVLGSNRGGIPEIIRTIHGGEVFASDDKQDFKQKLVQFIEMDCYDNYYAGIIQNIEKYSVSQQVKNFEKIYKQLVEE